MNQGEGAAGAAGNRYRILLSDGKYSYAYGMLATQLNPMISSGQLENYTIIKLNKVICNKVNAKPNPAGKEPRKIIILLEIEVLVPGSQVCTCFIKCVLFLKNINCFEFF